MKWRQLLVRMYQRLSELFDEVLEGLTMDDVHKRPAADANTIGWLLWHTARSLDRTVGDIILGEQLWIKDKWYVKFGRSIDSNDTGWRHTVDDVGKFRIPNIQSLREYFHVVVQVSIEYLESLNEEGLDQLFDNSLNPGTMIPVYQRIEGNIVEHFQHIGQAAYVRGLLKGQGWLGR